MGCGGFRTTPPGSGSTRHLNSPDSRFRVWFFWLGCLGWPGFFEVWSPSQTKNGFVCPEGFIFIHKSIQMMIEASTKLSPLQLELLKIYSFQPSEAEMIELKNILARFFAQRFVEKVEVAAQNAGLKAEDIDQWLEEDGQ
jgi:hypothetical protein